MSRERLSKLQKYIIEEIYDKTSITFRGAKRYFNKEDRDTLLNNKERVTLHKSFQNMLAKGLIEKGSYKNYLLTEKGFNILKANVFHYNNENINFKDYQSRQQEEQRQAETLYEDYVKTIKEFIRIRDRFW